MKARPLMLGAATAVTAVALGYVASTMFGGHHVGKMLPWVLGRGLGLAGYLTLVVLTMAGLWLRHPWRFRWRRPAVELQLRVHAVLAALTVALIAGHIVALVLDRYAGVGWTGAVAPGAASYRPFAVALGTAGLYLGLLVGGTAALAGRLGGRIWLPVHRLAVAVFALVWFHAVLAGSDAAGLRPFYLGTGAAVVALALSRRLAPAPAPEAVGGIS